jgi:LacI family transcriptional regulator
VSQISFLIRGFIVAKSTVSRLKDVARAAKVSEGAASRILRGDTGPFRAETIDRVNAAASQLGWRRNLLVSGMQTGQTQTVGVLIPPYDYFWINVLSGIHNVLSAADFLPITIWIGDLEHVPFFEDDDQKGIESINRLLDRRVQALIAWPQIACAYRKCFELVAEKNVPVVVIDLYDDQPIGDAVLTCEQSSSYLVAEHLLDLGHRNFGCFSTERENNAHHWAVMREKYFRERVAKVPGTSVQTVKRNAKDLGRDAVRRMLQQEDRPSAIFALTDHLAATVYQIAAELRIRIPEDLSVVGFSDLDFATKLSPPLTTLHQQPKVIGGKAAELVLKRINEGKNKEPFKQVEVSGWLVKRESTAPPVRS